MPYTDDDASVDYLAAQLETMVRDMEEQLGRKFQPEKLKESLRIENETRCELLRFYELAQRHYYPGEIIHQLYMMMGTHLLMGTQKFLDLIRFMNEEIQTFPEFTGKRILWIHLIPYYQESLKYYFNSSEKYQLLGGDIIFDFTDTLDPEDPFRSLARKLIKNVYNGSYSHKAQAIGQSVRQASSRCGHTLLPLGMQTGLRRKPALKRGHEGTQHSYADSGRRWDRSPKQP